MCHLYRLATLNASPGGATSAKKLRFPLTTNYNNNNNLIYIAPACRMTSEALNDFQDLFGAHELKDGDGWEGEWGYTVGARVGQQGDRAPVRAAGHR